MNKRINLFIIALLILVFPKGMSGATHDDNIIIDNEIRIYTISEKNGQINSVKAECDTYYEALATDGFANAIATYNDNITIDKASAPGAKPFYRSWETPDVFYDGSKICYMRVPVNKGKKVKVTFHQTFRKPEHFCELMIPSSFYKTRCSKIIINVPSPLASTIKITPHDFTSNISLTKETLPNGSVTYFIEAIDLMPWKYEPGAPGASESAPRVTITGQFENANSIYQYFRTFLDDAAGYDDVEIVKLSRSLREKTHSNEALIDSIAAWVRQNIRYLAVEHGEYAFRPSSPSEVIRSRAADCKGSANLIKTLLKMNGLDGRLAWIGTHGDISYDWDSVPALCSGNHVIAACVYADSTIFIDGTTAWSSAGYIPPSIRGQNVMIEDGENCILTKVTDCGNESDKEKISAKFSIEGNDLIGTIHLQLYGINKMSLLSSLAETEPINRQKILNRYLTYPKRNSDVSDIIFNPDLSQQVLGIDATIKEKNSSQKIGDKIYIDLKPIRDSYFNTIDTVGRTHPYRQHHAYSSTYEFEVKIPDNYKIHSIPESVKIDNQWHKASIVYSGNDGVVKCEVNITTKDLHTPLDKIPQRNEAIKAMRRTADTKLVLITTDNS